MATELPPTVPVTQAERVMVAVLSIALALVRLYGVKFALRLMRGR
jgi:hypothetical protein